jgi:hypothetical protein
VSLFDVIKYPIGPNDSFLNVAVDLPQEMRQAFYHHPEYQTSQPNESFHDAYKRLIENTALLRRVILEWNTE